MDYSSSTTSHRCSSSLSLSPLPSHITSHLSLHPPLSSHPHIPTPTSYIPHQHLSFFSSHTLHPYSLARMLSRVPPSLACRSGSSALRRSLLRRSLSYTPFSTSPSTSFSTSRLSFLSASQQTKVGRLFLLLLACLPLPLACPPCTTTDRTVLCCAVLWLQSSSSSSSSAAFAVSAAVGLVAVRREEPQTVERGRRCSSDRLTVLHCALWCVGLCAGVGQWQWRGRCGVRQ